MHHAWLITGKPGIGKASLAYRFARWRLAGAPWTTMGATMAIDPAHPVFRRVAAGTHADLLTVEREFNEKTKKLRSEIVVEDVRAVGNFLRLTPAEDGWRVVIVDGAEKMNRNAANALLKILEEPPPRAVLLLVCSAPGRLPATLRSRCRQLILAPLAEQVVASLLDIAQPDLPADQRARLAALADGSIGRALELAEGEAVAIAALVQEILGGLPGVSVLRAHEVADKLGRNDTGFATFMDLTRSAISTALGNVLRGRAEPWQSRLAELRPLAEWADIWHALGRLADDTERAHLDKRQAVVSGIALLSRK
jgi:DNA polymerase-3 subunit delta'